MPGKYLHKISFLNRSLSIAHDLQVVANICDRILFLYQGEIVEELDSTNLIHVQHDYANKLLGSVMPFTPVFLM